MPRFDARVEAAKGNMAQLRKKTKTRAELRNEQFDIAHGGDQPQAMGVAEDYEWDEPEEVSNNNNNNNNISSLGGKRAREGMAGLEKKPLRHRGPLDPALSLSKYRATPRSVESKMDDLFGGLDMADIDAEADEEVELSDLYEGGEEEGGSDVDSLADEDEGPARKKRKLRTKDLNEEQYAAWFERKSRKGKRGAAADDAEEGDADASYEVAEDDDEAAILKQVEELRQSHLALVAPQATAEAAAERQQKQTQETVRQYIGLYGQLLKLRVKLQPAVTTAIRFPQYYALPLFCGEEEIGSDDGGEGETNAAELTSGLKKTSELRAAVTEQLTDILGLLCKGTKSGGSAKRAAPQRETLPVLFDRINKFHTTATAEAKECLGYWGSKLVRGGGDGSGGLRSISQSLPKQIETILAMKTRLRQKVQKNRSHIEILGHPDHVECWLPGANHNHNNNDNSGGSSGGEQRATAAKARRAAQLVDGDLDEEIFDDADYLRECVRRGSSAGLATQLAKSEEALRPSKAGARKGFHKLTKGRTVSYEVRPKLVGFVVPEPYEGSGRSDVVVRSLLQ